MKKSLVLAMAMALGVTASAYASNPFTDVPAGHWAYDSISKLAAAGIIEGYGDDTFRGDRLMTRYEMAQIVAKALAKGANVDRLAAEFADELDALGFRVAALEKKSDNVQITGEVRYHYAHTELKNPSANEHEHGLRTRLYFTGKVNDNWNYVGRIENQQWFDNNKEDNDTEFNVAQLEGRLGGLDIVAGKQDDVFADVYIYDGSFDAIKAKYGDKLYISGAFGRPHEADDFDYHRFWQAEIGTATDGFADGKVGVMSFGGVTQAETERNNIFYAGLNFNLGKDLALSGMYLKSNNDKFDGMKVDDDGYVVGLNFKGAEAEEPGSWGLFANYFNQGRTTYIAHTIDGYTDFNAGFKGWAVGANVTVAKNMVANVAYYDTKSLKSALDVDEGTKARVLWSQFDITF
ncbi:MAG: S-layer homology domain-containing protein [Acidaminococcaceae bacterium]|nr:S-layer homology domain-containing protein [Acidaminococcaceae bacterium]